MRCGFVIDSGAEYYCSEKCLSFHYSAEEWDAMFLSDEHDAYWTDWETCDECYAGCGECEREHGPHYSGWCSRLPSDTRDDK